ncbi:MAG: autoinducer 2 ABC transporter substrate-binding protein [Thermotogae bacterium]|nr:autoinducer 2 ABC transporter substrate-binding protein [Thermotogota bacterium]
MRKLWIFLLISVMILLTVSSFATYKIAFIPKLVGIPYFNAMEAGGKRAAKDLGVEFIYTGPTTDSVAKQIEIIDNLITKGVDAIAVAPNDPAAITPIMKKAKGKGILTMTSDTDGAQNVREVFVNQARPRDIGYAVMDVVAELMDYKGKFAIVSGGPTAWNLNTWIMYLQQRLAEYPDIELVTIRYAGEDVQKAVDVGLSVIQAFPDIKVIVGMNSTSAPGVAEAVELAGKVGQIWATGITVPSMMKEHMKKGSVKKFVLWDPENLGYLTVWAAKYLLDGNEFPANKPIDVPGISTKPIYYPGTKELVLGPPLVFTPENIDKYNF